MIIQENQLRPPSPKEMAARHVPLESIRLDWYYDCWDDTHCRHNGMHDEKTPVTVGYVYTTSAGFTTLELIEFHKDHAIPYEAFVVGDGYDGELALSWTHVLKCEGCGQWYDSTTEHETTDTSLHGYIVRAREAAVEAAKARDKGRLSK
jgi:hypothetical protein